MSDIQQHKSYELMPLNDGRLIPGTLVSHVTDGRSAGTLISRVGDSCNVLWSQQPAITVAAVNSPSRRLSVKWSSREAEYFPGKYTVDKVEVEEEYDEFISLAAIKELAVTADRVEFHVNGHTTVKRTTRADELVSEPEHPHLINRKIRYL